MNITICQHCHKVGYSTRGWDQKCKLHAIDTDTDHVIFVEGKEMKVVDYYDPDAYLVGKEIRRRYDKTQHKLYNLWD